VKKPLAPRFPLMRGESEKGWPAGKRGRVVGPPGSIDKARSQVWEAYPGGASPNCEEKAT